MAIPNDDPTRCAVLNMPLAPPRSAPATVLKVKLLSGEIMSPLPIPAINNGIAVSQGENAPDCPLKISEVSARPDATRRSPTTSNFRPILEAKRLLFAAAIMLPSANGLTARPEIIAERSNPVCQVSEKTKKMLVKAAK